MGRSRSTGGGNNGSSYMLPDGVDAARVTGPHNSHLRQLSQAFSDARGQTIEISVIGDGGFAIKHGSPPQKSNIRAALRLLAARAENEDITDTVLREVITDVQNGAHKKPANDDVAGRFNQSGSISPKFKMDLPKPRSAGQEPYMAQLFTPFNDITLGVGPAGTGKTYLAVAAAVHMFVTGQVERIILTRPVVEVGERLGHLPGDMKEKVDPYMQPLYDALNDFLPPKDVQRLIEQKKIEIAPLAYMRGRTFKNAFIVLDEAQNTTTMQMKMFLTRLGEDSRMAITGDLSQNDLPKGIESGLKEACRILKNIPRITIHHLQAGDVVRHPTVKRIIEAYEADNAPESAPVPQVPAGPAVS